MLYFIPVTESNKSDLSQVKLEKFQESFTETISESLEEALINKEWIPLIIYNEFDIIGFTMYGYFERDDELWIDTIMIDCKHQGKGYGREVMEYLIRVLREDYSHVTNQIYLSVFSNNTNAIKLYKDLGFVFNNKIDTKGESIMEYSF